MAQSISAQGRMAQSSQMPAVFLRGHSDWFPSWQSAATTPLLVFKCLVYGSQNWGWVYLSKQLQFKWHFKTNSWHLSGSEANRFMNTNLLFINITWPFLLQLFVFLAPCPRFKGQRSPGSAGGGLGEWMLKQSLEGLKAFLITNLIDFSGTILWCV